MPSRDTPPMTRAMVLRGGGFALAIALGGVAVWLIVTSTTQKRIEIGVLTGLWGLLLGAYSMFGARKALQYGDAALDVARPGAALELRSPAAAVERAEDLAERRAFQANLEQLLRREVQTAVRLEVGELRSEIAALRSELLEKVGGQIRLERIETTRVIGSDLEALQQEVRQLKVARQAADPLTRLVQADELNTPVPVARVPLVETTGPIRPVAPEPAGPAPAGAEPVEPEPALIAPEASAPEPAGPQPVEPVVAPADPAPEPPAGPAPVAVQPVPVGAAAAGPPEDPFAGLPRIRPFTDFALDPIEAVAARVAVPPAQAAAAPATNGSSRPAEARRHAVDDPPDGTPAGAAAASRRSAAAGTPRRHRRADESNAGQELLARLLARETH